MTLRDFADLDALKNRLDGLRPLPPAALRNLHEELVLRWTYHSNAIEGNTLTVDFSPLRDGNKGGARRHHGGWQVAA